MVAVFPTCAVGLGLSAAVILLRMAWVYPAAYLPPLLSRRVREREGFQAPRAIFVVGWAGIRGSVTLAAALSIPLATATACPTPGTQAAAPRGSRGRS